MLMTTKAKRKRGGQPKENPLSERLPEIRVTPEQAKLYREAAKQEGQSFGAWARELFDKAIKRKR